MEKVGEFEEAVWAKERIRIVIRTAANRVVKKYNYERAAPDTWSISRLLEKRIQRCESDLEVIVIQGNGEQPRGNVVLRTLRASYRSQ